MLDRKLGHYRVLERIGAGGMGVVYRARDEHLERDVALKVLPAGAVSDERARKRFRKEALALSKLNHPNIGTVHDFSSQDGLDFLVMEYVEGTTLSEKLAHGPLPEREIINWGAQAAEGLAAAHKQDTVHRDIKPDNVRITPDGRVKILDFGLAQLVQTAENAATADSLSQMQTASGTLPYMSPEQLQGEAVDPRTDIHGLGAVLYEMATGQRPFPEHLVAKLVEAILHQPPIPPRALNPRVSAELERIILKCLEKDPENRYQSAKEVAVDLRRLGAPTASAPVVARHRRKLPRRTVLVAAGIAGLLVVAAVVALKFTSLLERLTAKPGPMAIGRVVALPSKVFAPEGDGFLADAVPSLLSTHLAQVEGLEVKAPPTSIDFERVGGDVDKIVDAYKVDGFVLSTVTVQADRLVLNLQLVEAGSRRLVWSHEYAEERQSYIELVRTAADGLRAAMRPAAAPVATAPVAASSAEAELLFQRGQYYAQLYSYRKRTSDFDLALSTFERLLREEPTQARAAAGIAGLYVSRIEAGAPLPETLAKIDEWAKRALEIDPRSGEAWRVLSIAEQFRPQADRRKRIEYALKAASLASKSGRAQHALGTALARNSFRLTLEALHEASRLDPLQLNSNLAAAGGLALLGRTSEGYPLVDDVLKIEPDILVGQLVKSFLLLSDRRLDEASAVLKRLEPHVAAGRLHPGWYAFAQDWLAYERGVKAGDTKSADAALGRLVKLAQGKGDHFPQWETLTLHVVLLLARHGQNDAALETLNARLDAGLVEPYDLLMQNPDLEPLRRDPRFQKIAARSRVKFEELMVILQEARERGECPGYLEKPLLELLSLPGLERRAS